MAETQQGICELLIGPRGAPGEPFCGRPAVMRYPTNRGGWQPLCEKCGEKHAALVDTYGERWNGQQWQKVANG